MFVCYITFLIVVPTNCLTVRPCNPELLTWFWTLSKIWPHGGLWCLYSLTWRSMAFHCLALQLLSLILPTFLLLTAPWTEFSFFCNFFKVFFFFFAITSSMEKFSEMRMLRSQCALLHMTEFFIYVQSLCSWQVVCSTSISKYIKKHYCRVI